MSVAPAGGTLWKSRAADEARPRPSSQARKYRSNHDRLDEVQQELAARFLPLARALAKPLKQLYPYWRDEFESAACLALVEAARSFDPKRRIQFATFARIRIRGALIDVSRAMILPGFEDEYEPPGTVALTPYSEEHGAVLVATQPPAVGADVDDIDEVEHWLRKLPRRHANVCRLYYLYGKTQAEIAEVVGCSQSEITRLHRRSIDYLAEPYRSGASNQQIWRKKRPRRRFDPAKPKTKTKAFV